jgi:hypothetical protein
VAYHAARKKKAAKKPRKAVLREPEPDQEDAEAEEPAGVQLPSLETVIDWYENWEETTRDDRQEMQRDYDYYDGEQWTAEEEQELKDRGQPKLTKNRIARKVNYMLGDLEETGVDPEARPKTPQHEDDARAATDALRATEEGQKFDTVRSDCVKDLLVAGVMGTVIEGDADPGAATCAPLTRVQWDRLWWDPFSALPDFSDGLFRGIFLWQEIEDAIEAYPDARAVLEAAVNASDRNGHIDDDKPTMWVDRARNRVRINEVYFKAGGEYYKACFTGAGDGAWLQEPAPTGFLDEKQEKSVCPLEMMSCHVRSKDNARYGIVRALISPQDEVNKRDSKSLHLLSVNGVLAEQDAIPDPEKFMTELAKADGLAEVAAGSLSDPNGARVQIRSGAALAAPHMQMAQQARADIDGIGPSGAGLPELPQSASGVAFQRRQKSASKELAPVHANIKRWDVAVMQQNWMRICQFRTEEWWLRVTDDQELTGYRWTVLNQQMSRAQRLQELLEKGSPLPKALDSAAGNVAPEVMRQVQMQMRQAQQMAMQQAQMQPPGQPPAPPKPPEPLPFILQHPLMQEVVTLNQAAKMGVDIMIVTTPESAILEDEEFAAVSEVLKVVVPLKPDLAPTLLEVLFQASHFRSKKQILAALKKEPDPEEQKKKQQAEQMQLAMAQSQLEQGKAGVAVAQSQAQLNQAKAAQAHADAQTTGPLAQADIQSKKAQAMAHAASAGETAGGGAPPPFAQRPGGM